MHRLHHYFLFASLAAMPAWLSAQSTTGAPDQTTGQHAGDVAMQPLEDVGIKKLKVPPALAAIEAAPYSVSSTKSCAVLNKGISEMDAVLGTDVDTPRAQRDKTANTALDVAGGVVNSVIPLRGLIRVATGADAAQRRYSQAVFAGVARRSYLKGLASARGCRR